MKLKDYLKDKLLYIAIYFMSIALVIIIMVLDLLINKISIDKFNILYAFILSFLGLGIILLLDYIKKKKFFDYIANTYNNHVMEQVFNIPEGVSYEYKLIKDIMVANYVNYIDILEKQKKSAKTQMNFNNRWIHEMKTPISVIKLTLENEKDKSLDDLSIKNYKSMEEELEKLSKGLEMALYTLRINDFSLDFKIEQIDIVEQVRSVINENKSSFILNSIFPKLNVKERYVVNTDSKWIKFVISQIIANAIKYTRLKDIENKQIEIDIIEENKDIILSIKDNGIGISTVDLDKIFDPFFTGLNGRKHSESTGMGLYLVKETLDRLGHKVEIFSKENQGTTVNIIFYYGKSIYNLDI